MNTIVVIEDDPSINQSLDRWFKYQDEYQCTVVFLSTLDEAEQFLEDELPNRSDIVAITFDGSMMAKRNTLDTLHLVRLAKEASFGGIMMACSSDPDFCKQLCEAGCTHRASTKAAMPSELLELLK